MPVEHIKGIFGIPVIRKEEHLNLSRGKKQKPPKKEQKKESGKVDIKV